MADLQRILALPAPLSYVAATNAGGRQLRPVESVRGDAAGSGLAANPSEASAEPGDQESAGPAKRFRFRVYDGGGRDTQSADLQQYRNGAASGQARTAQGEAAGSATARSQGSPETPDPTGAGRSEPRALATFLAQLISQEQLGQGLHAPPIRAADIAYRRAGGEPSIDIGSPARFSLAV